MIKGWFNRVCSFRKGQNFATQRPSDCVFSKNWSFSHPTLLLYLYSHWNMSTTLWDWSPLSRQKFLGWIVVELLTLSWNQKMPMLVCHCLRKTIWRFFNITKLSYRIFEIFFTKCLKLSAKWSGNAKIVWKQKLKKFPTDKKTLSVRILCFTEGKKL